MRIQLHVANGLPVWSVGRSDDVPDAGGNVQIENLLVEAKMNELLARPFEKALQMCPELQQHIAAQENAKDVKEEFRQAWGPDGSLHLRDVLRQLLGVSTQSAGSPEDRMLLDEPNGMPADRVIDASTRAPEVQRVARIVKMMKEHFSSPEMNFFAWQTRPDEGQAKVSLDKVLNLSWAEGADGSKPKDNIDDLLRTPFDEALKNCAALQQYIAAQPDAKSTEQEFREAWGTNCEPLRGVVEALLDPEIAAANKKAADALRMEMEKNAFLRGDRSPMHSLGRFQDESMTGERLSMQSFRGFQELSSILDFSESIEQSLSSMVEEPRAKLDPCDSGGMDSIFSYGPGGLRPETNAMKKDQVKPIHNFCVDNLLSQSFEAALQLYPALNDYISNNDETKEEFSSKWAAASADVRSAVSHLFIQDLLNLTFERALEACAALRQYVEDQERKRSSVKEEFENHWGLEAPTELRLVLEELLKKNGSARVDDDEDDDEDKVSYAVHSLYPPYPPPSRL